MKNRINISVVIPLYNKELYISRSLQSVLNQNPQPNEIIVIDDGSTDNSYEFAAQCSLLTNNIKIIQQGNRGAASARNLGIKEAQGEYIVFLDADDELLPGAINAYFEMIRKFPECAAYGLNFYTEINNIRLTKRLSFIDEYVTYQKIDYFKGLAFGDVYLTASTCCAKKAIFNEIGVFSEGMIQREDPHMWIRIAANYSIAFCIRPLALYHLDDPSRICIKYRAVDDFADSILLNELIKYRKLNEYDSLHARIIIAENYISQAFQNLHVGDIKRAKNCLSNVSIKFTHKRSKLFAAFFFAYTGLWRYIPKI